MFLLCMVSLFVVGQADTNIKQNIVKELTNKIQKKESRKLTKGEIADVYLYKDWNNKGAVFANNKKYILENINYNVLSDSFDAIMNKDSVYTFKSSQLDSIKVNGLVFVKLFSNSKNSFFQKLVTGEKLSLFKKISTRTKKGKYDNLTGKTTANRYIKVHKYYILKNESLFQINLNKKTVMNLFDDGNDKAITNFVKKEKLSFKRENSVIKIIKYYNSLIL